MQNHLTDDMGICENVIWVLYASFDKPLSEACWQYYLAKVPLNLQNKILSYHRWQDRQAGLFGKLLLSQGLKLVVVFFKLINFYYSSQ